MFKDSVIYPFRDDGWIVIVLGALLAGALKFVSHLPLLGFVAGVFSTGYFAAFYFDTVASTITGHDRCPDWPSVSSFWDDILVPYFRVLAVALLSFLPLIIGVFTVDRHGDVFWAVVGAAIVFAFLYFPMAMLGVVVWGGIIGALPHRVLPAIIRCSPVYLMIFLARILLGVITLVTGAFLLEVPFVGWLLSAALLLYLLLANARFIGLFYRRYQEKIGWG